MNNNKTNKFLNDFEKRIILQKLEKSLNVVNIVFNIDWANRAFCTCYFLSNGVLCSERVIYSQDVDIYDKPTIDNVVKKINSVLETAVPYTEAITHNCRVKPSLITPTAQHLISNGYSYIKNFKNDKFIDISISDFDLSALSTEVHNMMTKGSSPAEIFDFIYTKAGIDPIVILESVKNHSSKTMVNTSKEPL